MAKAQQLTRSAAKAGHALSVNGQYVWQFQSQLSSVLASRLGRQHAALLAIPVPADNGETDWTTTLSGPVVPAAALQEAERAALLQRAERMLADIRGLAARLRDDGAATAPVAAMIEQAVRTPPGDWLFSVSGQPVLAMWGHAAEPGAISVLAPIAAAATAATVPPNAATPASDVPSPAPESTSTSAAAAAPLGATTAAGKGSSSRRSPWRFAWLLLPLAALAVLLLTRCNRAPVEDLSESLVQAERDNRTLEEAINAKRNDRQQFECVRDPLPPERPASEPPPPAPSAPLPSPPPPPEPASALPPPASKPAPKPAPKPSAPVIASAPAPKPAPVPPPAPLPDPPVAKAPPPPPPAPAPAPACKPRGPGEAPEVVMIIDASGSMREPFGGATSRLEAAKRASGQMIRALPPDVDVGLVDFSACGKVRRDRFYSANERGQLTGEIDRLTPQQGTPLAEAISRAGTIAGKVNDNILVVVSDGDDSCGGDPCAAARTARAAKPNLTINVIDLSTSPRDRQVLECVARAGGGKLLRPGDTLDLNQKMKEAAGPANCP